MGCNLYVSCKTKKNIKKYLIYFQISPKYNKFKILMEECENTVVDITVCGK